MPTSLVRKRSEASTATTLRPRCFAHGLLDLGELVFAEDAVVDEDAGQAIADRLRDQDCGYGGVDAAREPADGVAFADLGLDALDGGLNEVFGGPVGLGAAEVEDKVAEQFHALAGVGDLGVELDGPDFFLFVGDAGYGVGCLGNERKAGREHGGIVAVGHPDVHGGGEAGEEWSLADEGDFGVAVLAVGGAFDASAQVVGDELEAVADAEDGDAEGEDGGVGGGRVGVVDRAGAAREDDAEGVEGFDLVKWDGAREDNGEDVELADAACDELGVLRTKVEDNDR